MTNGIENPVINIAAGAVVGYTLSSIFSSKPNPRYNHTQVATHANITRLYKLFLKKEIPSEWRLTKDGSAIMPTNSAIECEEALSQIMGGLATRIEILAQRQERAVNRYKNSILINMRTLLEKNEQRVEHEGRAVLRSLPFWAKLGLQPHSPEIMYATELAIFIVNSELNDPSELSKRINYVDAVQREAIAKHGNDNHINIHQINGLILEEMRHLYDDLTTIRAENLIDQTTSVISLINELNRNVIELIYSWFKDGSNEFNVKGFMQNVPKCKLSQELYYTLEKLGVKDVLPPLADVTSKDVNDIRGNILTEIPEAFYLTKATALGCAAFIKDESEQLALLNLTRSILEKISILYLHRSALTQIKALMRDSGIRHIIEAEKKSVGLVLAGHLDNVYDVFKALEEDADKYLATHSTSASWDYMRENKTRPGISKFGRNDQVAVKIQGIKSTLREMLGVDIPSGSRQIVTQNSVLSRYNPDHLIGAINDVFSQQSQTQLSTKVFVPLPNDCKFESTDLEAIYNGLIKKYSWAYGNSWWAWWEGVDTSALQLQQFKTLWEKVFQSIKITLNRSANLADQVLAVAHIKAHIFKKISLFKTPLQIPERVQAKFDLKRVDNHLVRVTTTKEGNEIVTTVKTTSIDAVVLKKYEPNPEAADIAETHRQFRELKRDFLQHPQHNAVAVQV